jgi:hypothetical protein
MRHVVNKKKNGDTEGERIKGKGEKPPSLGIDRGQPPISWNSVAVPEFGQEM